MGSQLSKRTYGLDVFRAVAIVLVVKTHGAFILGDLNSYLPKIPHIDGVDLFFVLSGFLIGGILIKNINKDKFTYNNLLIFWKRRWFRTLPNYYLFLLANFLLVYYGVLNGKIENVTYKFLFFIQNFSGGFTDFFWESWSLSIEEWFYIFLPILLILFLLLLKPQKAFLYTVVVLIVFPVLYRYSISSQDVDRFWFDTNFRKVVLTRLDSIGYGVLFAYLKYYHFNKLYKYKNALFVLGIFLIYLNIYIPSEPNSLYSKVISFSVSGIGAAMLLVKADSVKSFKIGIIGKLVTLISLISYSMYLVNLMVAQIITNHFPPSNKYENLFYYAIYWVITITLSFIIYKFFEKPITRLRDK